MSYSIQVQLLLVKPPKKFTKLRLSASGFWLDPALLISMSLLHFFHLLLTSTIQSQHAHKQTLP